MSASEQLNYGVIGDVHGHYDQLARVVDKLEPTVDKIVLVGDMIDGPDSRRTIGLIRELGETAITIAGNHEWVLRNALDTREDPLVGIWRSQIWPSYETGMLESFGLRLDTDWDCNAEQLREAMEAKGDLAWLMGLPPYFETPDFIAVHAGPNRSSSWQEQAAELSEADMQENRLAAEPKQLFSFGLATPVTPADVVADGRIFVSGHEHSDAPAENRIVERRVCLASRVSVGQPLFFWHSGRNVVYS